MASNLKNGLIILITIIIAQRAATLRVHSRKLRSLPCACFFFFFRFRRKVTKRNWKKRRRRTTCSEKAVGFREEKKKKKSVREKGGREEKDRIRGTFRWPLENTAFRFRGSFVLILRPIVSFSQGSWRIRWPPNGWWFLLSRTERSPGTREDWLVARGFLGGGEKKAAQKKKRRYEDGGFMLNGLDSGMRCLDELLPYAR